MTARLETKRLILRPIELSDAPAVQRYFPEWEIIRNLSKQVPWPYPDNGAEWWLQNSVAGPVARGERHVWAITIRERGDECIGVVDYSFADEGLGNRGFWIALPFQGKGYMTEAIVAVQDHLFFDLRIDGIRALCAVDNTGSSRIKEKTGGVLVGETDAAHWSGVDRAEVWEIDGERWRRLRSTDRGGSSSK